MKWTKLKFGNRLIHAEPVRDIHIELIDDMMNNRFTHFKIYFSDGQPRRHKLVRYEFPVISIKEARSRAEKWFERNYDAILQAQVDTAPVVKSQADAMREMQESMNERINNVARLNELEVAFSKELADYQREYDRARRGERNRAILTGYKKEPVYKNERLYGSYGRSYNMRVVNYYEDVPTYRHEPDYPAYPQPSDELRHLRYIVANYNQ